MPENTIPAMIKAMDLGVTTLELDLAITKDGNDPFSTTFYEISDLPDVKGQQIDSKDH